MPTGLEWIRLSQNRSTAWYKIGAVDDCDSLSFLFHFFFLFFFNIICIFIWMFFLFYHHYGHHGRGLKRQSEASSNTAGCVTDIPKVDRNIIKSIWSKKYWLSATGNYQRIYWGGVRLTIRNVHDVIWIKSVHNMSHAGDICTNACILIIGTTKTYHHICNNTIYIIYIYIY